MFVLPLKARWHSLQYKILLFYWKQNQTKEGKKDKEENLKIIKLQMYI